MVRLCKKILLSFVFIACGHAQEGMSGEQFAIKLESSGQRYGTVGCLLLCIGDSPELDVIGKAVKNDLEFTDQLAVEIKKTETEPDTVLLPKLFNAGTSVCVYLKSGELKNALLPVTVMVKEASSGDELFSKTFDCSIKNSIHASHCITHELFPILTGMQEPVLSTLAYCKQVSPCNKMLCIADYACRKERMLFQSNTINLAPRWHTQAPLLFYSQLTKSKGKLMSFDVKTGRRAVVCAYDGLTMQPSFSRDGSRAVLCMSAGKKGNSELFLYDQKVYAQLGRRVFKQLTNNGGNNASPVMLGNDDIIFCSDFETGLPQIYYFDCKKRNVSRLTNGKGYCTAPSYCSANHMIVYNRLVKGVFQLCVMDLADAKRSERQITKGKGNKQEPSWSACGRYVAFSYDGYDEQAGGSAISQIAVLNLASKKIKVLTSGSEPKSFPCWINQTYYV